jgi:hypothetical protein
MTALNLVLTDAGMERFTAAQLGNPIDLTVSAIGLTAQDFFAAKTLTALPGEFRRVVSLSGAVVGDNVAHIVMRDEAAVQYTVRGFGLFLADGTLLAAYGQSTPIVEKAAAVTLHMPLDIAFPTTAINALTFGNADFLNPPATTVTPGVVLLATLDQANAGDLRRVTTGAIVKAMISAAIVAIQAVVDDALDLFGQALDGLAARTAYGAGLVKGGGRNDENLTFTVDAAAGPDVRAGTALDLAVTPAALAAAGAVYVVEQSLAGANGYRRWSDGLKECWGAIGVPANTTVTVGLPMSHTDGCVPTGSCSIAQDEASIGVLNPSAAGFQVRNRNPMGTTFYWHTKGL